MIEARSAALLMIDMQNGFIDRTSTLCVAGAAASVPVCARALDATRTRNIPVYHINRRYAVDGSDVEAVRYESWMRGGKPLSDAAPHTIEPPASLAPHAGEAVVYKPKFSAFFGTDLDMQLRERGINTVVLTGTTTPNCIRSTCYDALSLGYNVVVVEDATSSRTPAVQEANIEDMRFIGAQIISCADFEERGLDDLCDIEAAVRTRIAEARAAR